MNIRPVEKPIERGRLRRRFGKEDFILKRKLHWRKHFHKYATSFGNLSNSHSLSKHKSLLLRSLKDVSN